MNCKANARALALIALVLAPPCLAQSTSKVYVGAGESYPNATIEATDGTLVVTGQSAAGGAFVARLSPVGAVLWSRVLSDASATVRDHALAANGDILLCGGHDEGGLVMRLSPTGSVVWKTVLPWQSFGGEDGITRIFTTVIESSAGDVVLGGQIDEFVFQSPQFLFAVLDAQGVERWSSVGGYGWITDVCEVPGGALAYVGADPQQELSLVRLSSGTGTFLGARSLGLVEGTRPRVALSSDDQLLITPGPAGCTSFYHSVLRCFGGPAAPASGVEVMKLDLGGNLLWRRRLTSTPGAAVDLVPSADGGAHVLGVVERSPQDTDLALFRVDGAGDVLWEVVHGTDGVDAGAALSGTLGGGHVITGRAAGVGGGPSRPLFVRLDATGSVAGCTAEVGSHTEVDVPLVSTVTQPQLFVVPVAPLVPALLLLPYGLSELDVCLAPAPLGGAYCSPAALNSSGRPARAHVFGSAAVADDDLTLVLTDGPTGALGYFLAGQGTGTFPASGSQGTICLGGATIQRFSQLAKSTDQRGAFAVRLPSAAIPSHGPILAGETWNFQAWFRDANPGPTSNLSDAVAVMFL